jgi:hypothetical protein
MSMNGYGHVETWMDNGHCYSSETWIGKNTEWTAGTYERISCVLSQHQQPPAVCGL